MKFLRLFLLYPRNLKNWFFDLCESSCISMIVIGSILSKCIVLPTLAFCEVEKRVECVGTTEADHFTAILKRHNYPVKVVNADFNQLGKNFKKDKSWFGKIKQKITRSTPIHLDPLISKIIFMNIPNHLYRDYHLKKLPKEKLILFMWEPVMHARKMYNKNLHHCFSRVYTWDDDLVDHRHYFKFYYPCLSPMTESIPPFEDKKLCTMVSGYHMGKNFAAKYPSELYSERRKAVDFFEKQKEKGFDLYGRGWDPTNHPSYKGPIKDKINVIKSYRFSICYENCQNVKGYITEKIFDCFAAGNVPVYWGASNITDYIPKSCFIDRRDFATMNDLYLFLKNMNKEKYEQYLQDIRNFLKSDQAKLFSQETYEQIFFEAVKNNDL